MHVSRIFPRLLLVLAFAAFQAAGPREARAASSGCAILVSTLGTDVAGCGLTPNSPCRTIAYGIARAVGEGASCVFIRVGTYNEVVVPAAGVDLIGGFDSNWQPGSYLDPAHQVIVTGGPDVGAGGAGEYLTVRAHGLGTPTRIAEMVLRGPNAAGTVGPDGRSTYVVHAQLAQLTLERVRIEAGNGAAGLAGANGLDATSLLAAIAGSNGGAGDEFATPCNSSSRGGGGARGTNSCAQSPSARDMDGGSGGAGGTMDTDCGIFSQNLAATNGTSGVNADFNTGSFGLGGLRGLAIGCGPAGSGTPGLVVNGAPGTGGAGGSLSGSGYWYSFLGIAGSTGQNGSGGGGGGGSGGCDDGTDAYGAGGGGGGAGGCAARGGGGGGGGGGASFGVVAYQGSVVSLTECVIVRGAGGAGGSGGAGGQGQPGGAGGLGGAHPGSGAPGDGGKGAHGGHGGGGGGGAGGHSYAIIRTASSSVPTSSVTMIGGAGGLGGAGGVSAPFAAGSDDDGLDGGAGTAGTLGTTLLAAGLEPASEPAFAARAARDLPARTGANCDLNCARLGVGDPGAGGYPLAFEGVFPNPVTAGSALRFSLPIGGIVRIDAFDAGGRLVSTLANRFFPAGPHTLEWDLAIAKGGAAPTGLYLIRLQALGRSFTRRVTVLH